jgi:hypothetical protein
MGVPDDYATVDAVYLTSREQQLPEVYPDHTEVAYVTHSDDKQVGADLPVPRRMWDHLGELSMRTDT